MEEEMEHEMLTEEEQERLDFVRTQAFSNPLIFLKILRYLPWKELLECRKVSRVWCELSTEVLGVVRLEFEYSSTLRCFMLTPQRPTEYSCFESTKFNSNRLRFRSQHTLNKREAQIFRSQSTFVEDYYTLHSLTKMISQNNAIQEAQDYQSPASLFTRFNIGFAGFHYQTVISNEPNTSSFGDTYDRDIFEFVSLHGSRVKELNVDLYPDDKGGSFKVLGVLLRRMINMEKLNIGIQCSRVFRFGSDRDRQEEVNEEEDNMDFVNFLHEISPRVIRPPRPNPLQVLAQTVSNVQLPELKMVLYHRHDYESNNYDDHEVSTVRNGLMELKRILATISPNLTPEGQIEVGRRERWADDWTTAFIPIQRVDTVHNLTFDPHPTNLKLYEKFAKAHPKLSSILFDMKHARYADFSDDLKFQQQVLNILRKILGSSAHTLKEVWGRDEVENLEYLQDIVPLLPPKPTDDDENQNLMKDLKKNTENENKNTNSPVPLSIVAKILKCVPSSDLLSNTRLVSKDWCDVSTAILLARKAICINFLHYPKLHRFVRDKNAASKTFEMIRDESVDAFTEDFQTLHSLNTLIRRSSRPFPCVRFGLYNGLYDSRDLKEFIGLYGSKVKELELDLVEYNGKIPSMILEFVQKELPNLELFTLSTDHATRQCHRRQVNYRYSIDNSVMSIYNSVMSIDNSVMSIISPICTLKSQVFNDKETEKIWSDCIHSTLVLQRLKLEFRPIQPCEFTIDKINCLQNNNTSSNTPSVTVTHLEFKYDADTMDLYTFTKKMQEFIPRKPKLWSINFNFINCDSLILKGKGKVSSELLRLVKQILRKNQDRLMDIGGLEQIGRLLYQQENQEGGEGFEHFLLGIYFHNVRALTLNHVKTPGSLIVQNGKQDDDDGASPSKKLCLGHDESKLIHPQNLSSLSFLPSGCNISNCFPNLVKVTLNYIDYVISDEGDEETTTESYCESLTNVTTLVIQNCGGPLWVKKMSQMFPNVHELTWIVKQPKHFSVFAPSIWENFSRVKKLSLDFDWRSPNNNIVIGTRGLDAGFTGFSQQTCDMLECRIDKLTDTEVNQLRTNASIFNLKELSHLQMIFQDDSSPDEPRNFWSSQVAGRYVFDKLSLKTLIRLRVKTTKANQEKYKAVIAPFANYFYTDIKVVEKQ